MLSSELRKSLELAAQRYVANLEAAPDSEAANYLLVSRGIQMDAVRRYRLGVVDADSPDHPEYAGWLAIPYLTRAGVVSFKFRRLDSGEPKYIGPYETRLYNTLAMDQADRDGMLGIAEGELDALVATEYAGVPTVGIPGVEVYKKHPEWRELLRGYERVLIFQDDDEPGRQLAKQLKQDIDVARAVRLPRKDVNETFLLDGADAIREAAGL